MNNQILKLIPLGGIGDVTKNMYVYEYGNDIIVVDCGIGFPDDDMYGIDLVIPDVTYLKQRKQNIRGIFITHGHEDHIGALPYVLPELGKIPVYASRLAGALIENKLTEHGINQRVQIIGEHDTIKVGPFSIQSVHVTHSVPDASNYLIKTPVGTIYHGSDYKFDWTPVDGRTTDVGKIARAAQDGILCLLSDCVRIEKEGYTLSERVIEQTFEDEIIRCKGKFIVTTQSSNISRLQQAINVGLRHGRKICIIGRSIDQAITITKKLKYLNLPDGAVINDRQAAGMPANKILILAAGSQGQVESALSRITNDEHKFIKIKPGDSVIFSSDPIPGNENAVYTLIDELTRLGAKVVYTDILGDLHVSGHGSAHDIRLMVALAKAKYVLPIGGTYRHMQHFKMLTQDMGYKDENIILPENGQVITFDHQGNCRPGGRVEAESILIDGLGVGDVSNVVLRDRQQLAADGIMIVILTSTESGEFINDPDIISRGFVYEKEQEQFMARTRTYVKEALGKILTKNEKKIMDWNFIRKQLAGRIEEFIYRETHRRPMVIPFVVKV